MSNVGILPSPPPCVSVVVAVYKAEAYLDRCITTLRHQTLKEIEIILVDDGSPDRSGEMCDAYAAEDARIHVIHKNNGGVASARRAGFLAATGEYIIHCDPDDWVELDMYEKMYKKAQKRQADMVLCDYVWEAKGGTSYYKAQSPDQLTAYTVLKVMLEGKVNGSLWNKLIRRRLYPTDCFLPTDITIAEDVLLNVRILSSNPDIVIAYIPKAFYHYDHIVNSNSIVRQQNTEISSILLRGIQALELFIPKELDAALNNLRLGYLDRMFRLGKFADAIVPLEEYRRSFLDDYRENGFRSKHDRILCLALKGYPRAAYALSKLLRFGQRMRDKLKKTMKGS